MIATVRTVIMEKHNKRGIWFVTGSGDKKRFGTEAEADNYIKGSTVKEPKEDTKKEDG